MPSRLEIITNAFQDEIQKIAAQVPGKMGKVLPAMVAGGIGWETLRRANEDRKIGKQVRQQQNPGFLG